VKRSRFDWPLVAPWHVLGNGTIAAGRRKGTTMTVYTGTYAPPDPEAVHIVSLGDGFIQLAELLPSCGYVAEEGRLLPACKARLKRVLHSWRTFRKRGWLNSETKKMQN
jgi:hypothetical protein